MDFGCWCFVDGWCSFQLCIYIFFFFLFYVTVAPVSNAFGPFMLKFGVTQTRSVLGGGLLAREKVSAVLGSLSTAWSDFYSGRNVCICSLVLVSCFDSLPYCYCCERFQGRIDSPSSVLFRMKDDKKWLQLRRLVVDEARLVVAKSRWQIINKKSTKFE